MTSIPGFDLNFLKRIYYTTGISGILIGLMLVVYNPDGSYSFIAGLVIGIANLWAWSRLIQSLIKVGEINPREAVLTIIIKFPIILVLFFVLIYKGWVDVIWYVAGFSFTYLVILLKVIAIIMLSPKPKASAGSGEPGDGGDKA